MKIKNKFKEYGWVGDWTDWVLLAGYTIPAIIGSIMIIISYFIENETTYTIVIISGALLLGIDLGFYIGALIMRQFMLRWLRMTGWAKVEGKSGKEIVTFLKQKEDR